MIVLRRIDSISVGRWGEGGGRPYEIFEIRARENKFTPTQESNLIIYFL